MLQFYVIENLENVDHFPRGSFTYVSVCKLSIPVPVSVTLTPGNQRNLWQQHICDPYEYCGHIHITLKNNLKKVCEI